MAPADDDENRVRKRAKATAALIDTSQKWGNSPIAVMTAACVKKTSCRQAGAWHYEPRPVRKGIKSRIPRINRPVGHPGHARLSCTMIGLGLVW